MNESHYYRWIRLKRRYRNAQTKLLHTGENKYHRKVRILGKRILKLNRIWQLGISAATLASWLAFVPSNQAVAQKAGFPSAIELSTMDGNTGLVINGVNQYDSFGQAVSGAGDVNGDGLADIIVGAYYASPNGSYSGSSYVIFGSKTLASPVEVTSLDGKNGFVINGAKEGHQSGFSVAGAGDVNGDGLDDIIIGAPGASPNNTYAGAAYVVFGKADFPPSLELSSMGESDGIIINGIGEDDLTGKFVSGAGDINNDGVDDMIIASPEASGNTGVSYVVFGSSNGLPPSIELSSLDGTKGFTIKGLKEKDKLGNAVSSAGDLNSDGIDDIIIGAPGVATNKGASYVIFGRENAFDALFDLTSLDGTNGFTIKESSRFASGNTVGGGGDINGDGVSDLVVGAKNGGTASTGKTYIIMGSKNKFSPMLDLSMLSGNQGFFLDGLAEKDRFACSVSNTGDLNGDGIHDLAFGAYSSDPNGSYSGSTYIIFGTKQPATIGLSLLNGSNGFVVNGVAPADRSGEAISNVGDINGDSVDDLIIGAKGADPNGKDSAGSAYVIFGKGN